MKTKMQQLVSCLFTCLLATSAGNAMDMKQKATFQDDSGNEKKGFGAADCQNTKKTLKVSVSKNSEKIKHYSIHRHNSGSSTTNNEALRCSSSSTQPLISLDDFAVSILLPNEICSSSSGRKSDLLVCFWDDEKKSVIAQILTSYNTIVPSQPVVTRVEEREQQIKIVFEVDNKKGNEIDKVTICYAYTADNAFEKEDTCPKERGAKLKEDLTAKDASVLLDGLENGKEYSFKIKVKDTSGNQSKWSVVEQGIPSNLLTPLSEADWKRNPTSCGSAGFGGIAWLLWFVYFVIMRYKRNSRGKGEPRFLRFCQAGHYALFLIALFLGSFGVQAEPGQVSLGINGSPYKPDIDRKLTTPIYSKFYGKSADKGPWIPLIGIEANVHLFDNYGSIQLGPALSYTWASGYARKENGDPAEVKLQLHLYQIRPQLTYVFDPYVHVVPLAPYLRTGFIAMGYAFTFDGRLDRHGKKPTGFIFGWDAAFGMLFLLDGLQPGVSTRAQETGVYRHVYLKTELSYAQIDNFGMGGPLLSPKGIFGVSIPLMATFGLLIQL